MRLTVLLMFLVITTPAYAGVVWETNFDNLANWMEPYLPQSYGSPRSCTVENLASSMCTSPIPEGFYGWYVSKSEILPHTGNGPRIDNTNYRGAGGKAFTTYDHMKVGTTVSGAQLAIELPNKTGYQELYVRYWIKYQPGYYIPNTSYMQKLGHISHYVYNGEVFSYFTSGGFFPTVIPQWARANNGMGDSYISGQFRTDPSYNPPAGAPDKLMTYLDIPDDPYPIGSYSGGGTTFDTPGSIGDGNWHCLEFYVKNNSAPGVMDGVYRFWLDGHLQGQRADVLYREATSTLGDGIWNFVHLAGNSAWAGYDSGAEQWRAYDDVVIYTPLTAADPQWATSPQDGRLPLNYTITAAPADTTAPVVTAFTLPATHTLLTVPITTLTATDGTGVTGYAITWSSTPPTTWSSTPPTTVTANAGANTFYAWARDAAGNVSNPVTATVTVTPVTAPADGTKIRGITRARMN